MEKWRLYSTFFPLFCPQNYPLYISTIPTENELKFHYTVHTCLDVIEEKISAVGKSVNDPRELYLGLLYPTEDYKVYGYVTNTKVKFVIVVESSNMQLRDNEIRNVRMMMRVGNAGPLTGSLNGKQGGCRILNTENHRWLVSVLEFLSFKFSDKHDNLF